MTPREKDMVPSTRNDVTSAVINPYHMAVQQFEAAAEKLNLSEDLREVLRQPKRELTVNFPVRLDSGRVKTFTGYRVQHNVNRGPAKGGSAMVQT